MLAETGRNGTILTLQTQLTKESFRLHSANQTAQHDEGYLDRISCKVLTTQLQRLFSPPNILDEIKEAHISL